MDRFIGSSILVFVNVESDLKSNMDRFIDVAISNPPYNIKI